MQFTKSLVISSYNCPTKLPTNPLKIHSTKTHLLPFRTAHNWLALYQHKYGELPQLTSKSCKPTHSRLPGKQKQTQSRTNIKSASAKNSLNRRAGFHRVKYNYIRPRIVRGVQKTKAAWSVWFWAVYRYFSVCCVLVNIFGKRSYRTTGSPNTHLPLYTAHPVSCKYSGDFSRVWLFGVVGSAAAGTDAFEVSVTLAFDRAALCGCVWANRGKSFAQKNPTNFVCFSILVILYIVCGANREREPASDCVW